MKHWGGFFLFVGVVGAMWWTGLKAMAALVAVVCGLAGVAYLVVRRRQPTPLLRAEPEQDRRAAERYLP
jgi:hypothetical protein